MTEPLYELLDPPGSRRAIARNRLVQQWPRCLGAMLLLSRHDVKRRPLGQAAPAWDPDERVFAEITTDHLSLLQDFDQEPFEAISRFLVAVLGDGPTIGNPDEGARPAFEAGSYALVYLATSEPLIRLLLDVYVPLLRDGDLLWGRHQGYKLACRYADDVGHLLLDLQGVEEVSGQIGHPAFDWRGHRNDLPEHAADELLRAAGLPLLDDLDYPPVRTFGWLSGWQPGSQEECDDVLRELYDAIDEDTNEDDTDYEDDE